MRKLLVLAMVLMLSLSLVWAAETIKDTNQTAAKAKAKVTQTAPESQAVNPAQVPKAPRPAKVEDNATVINPNGLNEPAETPEIQSTKQAQKLSTEIKSVDVPAGYVGEGIDKEAAMLEALRQEAEQAKWQPQYGEKGELLNPEPTIDGFNYNQDNGGQTPIVASVLLAETFHQTGWDIDTPPLGWTAIDSGTEGSQTWYVDDWHKFFFTTMNDTVLASGWSTSAMSESTMIDWLITPTIDLSTATTCSLYLKEYYDNVSTVYDSANVMVSIDDGTTWVRVRRFAADSTTVRTRGVNLTPYVGSSTVKIGFLHCRLVPTIASNGWVVDSIRVSIDGVTPWVQDVSGQMSGWFGNTPPAGPGGAWTIQDLGNVSRPKAKNSNDWNRRVGNLGTDTVAAVTYTSTNNRREFENEWMISPMFSITGTVACTLSLNEYWNFDSPGTFFPPGGTTVNEHGYIKIQETTDGGTTWGPWQIVADHNNVVLGSSNTLPVYRGKYSLHTWRGMTVRLGFQKLAPPEASFATWYMSHLLVDDYTMFDDDVASTAILSPTFAHSAGTWPVKTRVLNVGNNTETFQDSTYIQQPNSSTIFFENFSNPSLWTGSNPPVNVLGTWAVIDSGSLGTPWDGNDWFAYYSFTLLDTVARCYYSPVEQQNEYLISPTIDLTGVLAPRISYSMNYSDYTGAQDSCFVLGTTDNWATKQVIAVYQGVSYNGTPDIDISSWAAGQSTVKIALRYVGNNSNYVEVGFVRVAAQLAPTVVYQNGETVTGLAPFASADVPYAATWNTPAVGAYQIRTFTALVGDGAPANDQLLGNITVLSHNSTGGPDAGFYSWKDSWAPGGPTFSWVDMSSASNATTIGGTWDDARTGRISMGGSSFYFEGNSFFDVFFSTNGFLSFDSLGSSYSADAAIPTAAVPNNIVTFMWDDMIAATNGIKYLNDVGNNRFVAEYSNIQFYTSTPSSDTFDCQIILDRDDSSIVVQYRQFGTELQTDAVIGIENGTGTTGLAYYTAANLGNYPTEGLAIKYSYTAPAADVGIASFDGPNGALYTGTPYTMSATAQNFTANSATFDVEFYADASLVGTATGVTLVGYATQSVSCPATWTPLTTGAHSLQAKTVYAGDSGPANDQITVSRIALNPPVTLPYTNDFETTNGGFTGTNEWEWGIPTEAIGPPTAHSGTQLWGIDLDAPYDPQVYSQLYLPPLDLTGGVAPILKFWMWHYTESTYDGANVKVSTDGGLTWTIVTTSVAYNGALSTANLNMGGQLAWYGSRGWTEVLYSLAPYVGTTILVKIDFAGDGSVQYAGHYVDDFSVAEPPSDDIGVAAILAPGTITIQGFTWQVAARVHNYGGGTQTNVPVHFEIYDILNNLVYNQTYTLPTIEAGVDSTVIFTAWAPAEADTHRFVSYTILAADIIPANDTSRATTYTYSHVGNGSGAHWSFADNVNGGGPAFSWVDISAIGTPLTFVNPDDGNSGMVAMGINFNFFNTVYNSINMNANGWMSFTDATSTAYSNVAIPTAAAPNGMVALLWDDLHIGTGTVYTYTDVVENQFIVEYHNVEYYSSGGPDCIDMEAIFDADDNTIKMQYNNFCTGSQTDVTVGVENVAGLEGLAYDNNGQVGQTPLNGVAVTFTYTPPDVDVAFDHTVGEIGAAGSLPVCANFTNTGLDPGNVTAQFEVRDAGNVLVFSGTGSGTVPAGGNANICAATNWTATPGTYTINVTATVPDDGNNANNNGTGSFIVTLGVATYPVFENFEHTTAVFPPPGWTVLHHGDDSTPAGTWQENHTSYRSPNTSAFQDDDPGTATKDEWLVMQPVDFSSAFQPIWKYYETGLYFESYGIAHEFWVCTGPVFDLDNAVLVAQHLPNVHVVPGTWDVGDEFDLSAFVGQPYVWCAFRYEGVWSDEWYIDDVSINGPDMYDAQVDAVVPSAEIVQPGDVVSLQVELSNNGYLPITATLTTVGVGTSSGTVYNDVTSGIDIPGFGTATVNLPDYTTVPACGEAYTFTSTVAAAGDTIATNNVGSATVSSSNIYQGNIVPGPYYYWPQVWYYVRKIVKPSEGVISHAVINFQDVQVPRSTFDFFIFGDSSNGGPDKTALFTATGVQGQYPDYTLIDINSVYASLPDSFFFAIKNTFGVGAPYYRGPISDQGQGGGLGSWRARNDSLNWLAFPYVMDFTTIIDVRGDNFLDLQPTAITAPGSVVIGTGPFAVTGTVANVGTGDIVGGSAHMVITGTGGTDFDVTMPVDLVVGATLPINFGNWAPSLGGDSYTLTLTVSVAGEGDVCNNTFTSSTLAITGAIAAFEDFEADNGGFASAGVWQYGAPTYVNGPAAYSGANVWGTILAGEYPIDACDSLITPAFAAPAVGGAMVFYLWYSTEYDWDGMNVKISVDGAPYTLVTPVGGYDLIEQGYLCPRMASMGYFTGASGGWLPKAVDLTPYAGHNVSFSFDFGSDGSVVDAGTYLDDFTIYDYFPVASAIVTPLSLSYTLVQDSANTYTGAFSINNDGLATLTYTATTSLPWITLGGVAGSVAPGGSDAIDVTVNTAFLVPGTYTDSVTVTSNDPEFPVIYKPVIQVVVEQGGCVYIPGDINGDNLRDGRDVSYGVNYFKGGALPPIVCDMCPQTPPFYAAGDVNATCQFNGIDITYFVGFLKGGPALQYCATCPPAGVVAAPAVIVPIGKAKVNEVGGN